jgi:dihydropteroate synthase
MRLKDRFSWGTCCYVMGILNISPDSFSGDGLADADNAVVQARNFAQAGADIIDVGGESTRPDARPLDVALETARVVPIIAAIRAALPDMPISVDTYRAPVARAALDAGADMVNDVWGLRADPDIAQLAAARGAPVILMHNRTKPGHADIDRRLGSQYSGAHYDDLLGNIYDALAALAAGAIAAGINGDQIILDPGLGFGKSLDQNLALMNHLDHFKSLGYPLLVGPSRKSFIGRTLDVPVEGRLAGTAAAVAISIMRGADIVRVHDVLEMAQVARMTDAILRAPLS